MHRAVAVGASMVVETLADAVDPTTGRPSSANRNVPSMTLATYLLAQNRELLFHPQCRASDSSFLVFRKYVSFVLDRVSVYPLDDRLLYKAIQLVDLQI